MPEQTEESETGGSDRKPRPERCDYCGAEVSDPAAHEGSCPGREIAAEMRVDWRHCGGEPELRMVVEGGERVRFLLLDPDVRFDDFAHDVRAGLNVLRRPVHQDREKREVWAEL